MRLRRRHTLVLDQEMVERINAITAETVTTEEFARQAAECIVEHNEADEAETIPV